MTLAVLNYIMGGEIQTREFAAPADVKENGQAEKYNFPEQRLQHIPQTENILEEDSAEESNVLLQNAVNNVQDPPPVPVDEPREEPQKRTYASIVCTAFISSVGLYHNLSDLFIIWTVYGLHCCLKLRVSKGQSASFMATQPSSNQNTTPASEWHYTPNGQQSSSTTFGRSGAETSEEVSIIENEG